MSCTIYDTFCFDHRFHHGAEANELREGIEQLLKENDDVALWQLQKLLDRVDARDSLAYLEASDNDTHEHRFYDSDGEAHPCACGEPFVPNPRSAE